MNSNRSFARRLLANCILASVLAATAWCGTALAAPSCSDFSGPKCQARLSTGITMRYREIGRQNRDAVFLLHGYTDSSRSWERVAPLLHRLLPGADIIIPDLRGHGDSSMPAGASCPAEPKNCFQWTAFAADIAFMDARHIYRAAIVAHSMGTLVAQELALSYPHRVSHLILISTAAAGQEPAVDFLLNQVSRRTMAAIVHSRRRHLAGRRLQTHTRNRCPKLQRLHQHPMGHIVGHARLVLEPDPARHVRHSARYVDRAAQADLRHRQHPTATSTQDAHARPLRDPGRHLLPERRANGDRCAHGCRRRRRLLLVEAVRIPTATVQR